MKFFFSTVYMPWRLDSSRDFTVSDIACKGTSLDIQFEGVTVTNKTYKILKLDVFHNGTLLGSTAQLK